MMMMILLAYIHVILVIDYTCYKFGHILCSMHHLVYMIQLEQKKSLPLVCGTILISYSKAQGCNFFIMLYRVIYRPEFQVYVSTQFCQTGN